MPNEMEAANILGMVLAFKIPIVNRMISGWSDHSIETIDTKTGERQEYEIDKQLKSQERQLKPQREEVVEKQKARDLTDQQLEQQ
jgi:hypothetical protein